MNGAIRDRIKELRRVKASDLQAHPKNWRVHPDHQRRAMEGVLAEIGYADALLARELDDGTLEIIDGHLRAETTPDAMVPVLVLDVDEKEADLLLATHDPLAAMAQTDIDIFTDLAQDIAIEDESVKGLLEAVANGEMSPMPFPEPERVEADPGALLNQVEADNYKPFTKPGNIWQLGDHRLMCGDATESKDVKELMGDVKAQMGFFDPPYGISFQSAVRTATRRFDLLQGDDVINGDWIPLAVDYLMDKGAIYICTRWDVYDKWMKQIALYIEFKNLIVLDKVDWSSGDLEGDYSPRHEFILYCVKGRHRLRGHRDSNVWNFGAYNKQGYLHPTQKKVELLEYVIGKSSDWGDMVIDWFIGSGTALIAAEKLGRRCYAMEIEPRYCDVAIRRWEDYTGRKAELTTSRITNGK